MNNIDKKYQALLQDILDNGVEKKDRTGTGTISVFGRQIRHKMSEGFPLLTTKKMYFKGIVTELLWFLRGDTNIKYLIDNGVHIWDGDAYKFYEKNIPNRHVSGSGSDPMNQFMSWKGENDPLSGYPILEKLTKEEFINRIKTDDNFAKKWGELGPIYGRQWRSWNNLKCEATDKVDPLHPHRPMLKWKLDSIDQIANLINDLKTNPDSRRLMVNSWNVSELQDMVLPPCHYGFQVYARELSLKERYDIWLTNNYETGMERHFDPSKLPDFDDSYYEPTPTRAISLMFNMRSNDVPLGLPFNIASYGLLLEIIGKIVNMIPDELIANLGDAHIYLNQIDGVKEHIGRKYTPEERDELLKEAMGEEHYKDTIENLMPFGGGMSEYYEAYKIPRNTREPFELPKLVHMKTDDFYKTLSENLSLITHLDPLDFQVERYKSHPAIKIPLSN